MTREEVKAILPILQAFAEGKVIEARPDPSVIKGPSTSNAWVVMKEIEYWTNTEYRIKPTPTYRPFKDEEECWNEMLKHQPFGWVKYKTFHICIASVMESCITFADNDNSYSFEQAFKFCTFADGSAFGVKVENED